MSTHERSAPAALRNRAPIGDVIASELPDCGTVLELASGSGEHAVSFAGRFPHLDWQPSDCREDALRSIKAHRSKSGVENLKAPIFLDAALPEWGISSADAIICINMVHISPWEATEGLFSGARRCLEKGAPLILYGPYFEEDVETVQSNLDFDVSLRARNPLWGLRQVAEVDKLADRNGFVRTARYSMPANNLILVYRKD